MQEFFIHFKAEKTAQRRLLLIKSSRPMARLLQIRVRKGCASCFFPPSSKNSPASRSHGPTFPRQRCSFTASQFCRGRGVEDKDRKCFCPPPGFPHNLQLLVLLKKIMEGWKDFVIKVRLGDDLGMTQAPVPHTIFCACRCVKMTPEMKDLHLRKTEP